MTPLSPLAAALAVALVGALTTLGVGALVGMPGRELSHLALLLLPAVLLTVAAIALVVPRLARASIRWRLLAVALVATFAALANLLVLTRLMLVSGEDAGHVTLLLAYAMAIGAAAALATARSSASALERLGDTAGRLGDGDLTARVGQLRAGPELDALGATLDRMAERLAASLARERVAEAQRRDLVTAVSHDLRTPLAGLRAMVEAIDEGVVDDPATTRRYASEMRRAVDSLVALVDDLFELVQLDAGAIEAESRRVSLEDAVRSAVAACEAQAAEKGLAVHTSLIAGGAESCSPRLARVVQNLLQNAIRHTPADGTVSVEARRINGSLEVVVEDTGEGIEADVVPHVFEPFWRGDDARSTTGSGLGLALAARIVEALGGRIDVESELTRGSRFEVVLPLSER